MALVTCPECNRRISFTAAACPGCGAPGSKIVQHLRDERAGLVAMAERDLDDARRSASGAIGDELRSLCVFNADYHRHASRERRWFRYSKLGVISLSVVAQFQSGMGSAPSALGKVLGGALAGLMLWSILVAPILWVVFRVRRPERDGEDSLISIRAEGLLTDAECAALIADELSAGIDRHPKVEAARAVLHSARAALAEVGGAAPSTASTASEEPVRPASASDEQQAGSQQWGVLKSLWQLGLVSFAVLLVVGAMQPPAHRSPSDNTPSSRSWSSGTETLAQPGPRGRAPEPEIRAVKWVVRVGRGGDAIVSQDSAAHEMFVHAVTSKDDEAVAGLLVSGRVFPVPDGTRVMILENGWLSKRVRVLNGDKAGQEGLIPSEHLKAE